MFELQIKSISTFQHLDFTCFYIKHGPWPSNLRMNAFLIGFTGSRKMEFKGGCWHEACFVCHHCRQPLGTKPLITKDKEHYCVPCFEEQFAHCCYACKKVMPLSQTEMFGEGRQRLGHDQNVYSTCKNNCRDSSRKGVSNLYFKKKHLFTEEARFQVICIKLYYF